MARMRGAIATPRHRLAAATPYVPLLLAAPTQLAFIPPTLSMWLNDQYGDCVTAEEAFAKAVASIMAGQPELFIADATVKAYASAHNLLNGAMLDQVLDLMRTHGFDQGGYTYGDGGKATVDYTNQAVLMDALSQGPVKLGVAAGQLEKAVGQHNGWFATGFQKDGNLDHCTGCSGGGPIDWLLAQLGVPGVGRNDFGVLFYTWRTIGVMAHQSLINICGEAWIRTPTTVSNAPTPTPGPQPTPTPTPTPSGRVFGFTFLQDKLSNERWSIAAPVPIPKGPYDVIHRPVPPPPPSVDPVVDEAKSVEYEITLNYGKVSSAAGEAEAQVGEWSGVEPLPMPQVLGIFGDAYEGFGAMTPDQALTLTYQQLQATFPTALPFDWQALIQAILNALSGNCFNPTPAPSPDPTPTALRAMCRNPSIGMRITVNQAIKDQEIRPRSPLGLQAATAFFSMGQKAGDAQWLGMVAAAKIHRNRQTSHKGE